MTNLDSAWHKIGTNNCLSNELMLATLSNLLTETNNLMGTDSIVVSKSNSPQMGHCQKHFLYL